MLNSRALSRRDAILDPTPTPPTPPTPGGAVYVEAAKAQLDDVLGEDDMGGMTGAL